MLGLQPNSIIGFLRVAVKITKIIFIMQVFSYSLIRYLFLYIKIYKKKALTL